MPRLALLRFANLSRNSSTHWNLCDNLVIFIQHHRHGISGDPGPGPETGNWFWSEMGHTWPGWGYRGGREAELWAEDTRTPSLWSMRLRLNKLGLIYQKGLLLFIANITQWWLWWEHCVTDSVDHWKLLHGQTWIIKATFIKQLLPFGSVWIREHLNWRILSRLH